MEQGRVAACHAFGVMLPPPPETFPYGIYSVPEISTVGQSEPPEAGMFSEFEAIRVMSESSSSVVDVDLLAALQ